MISIQTNKTTIGKKTFGVGEQPLLKKGIKYEKNGAYHKTNKERTVTIEQIVVGWPATEVFAELHTESLTSSVVFLQCCNKNDTSWTTINAKDAV